MPVIGRGNHDRVDLRIVEQPSHVFMSDRLVASMFLYPILCRIQGLPIDVAHRYDVAIVAAAEPHQVRVASSANTDQSQP